MHPISLRREIHVHDIRMSRNKGKERRIANTLKNGSYIENYYIRGASIPYLFFRFFTRIVVNSKDCHS